MDTYHCSLTRSTALSFLAMLWCALCFVCCGARPPSESKLVDNFRAHRAAYERLRDMLKEDQQLLRVGTWGVETIDGGVSVPPKGGFPVDRYNDYLTLLREAGGMAASRGQGKQPESISVLVWASGWAADTRHIQVCWMEHAPTNEVSSLHSFYSNSKPHNPVFKRIESNWYLWAD